MMCTTTAESHAAEDTTVSSSESLSKDENMQVMNFIVTFLIVTAAAKATFESKILFYFVVVLYLYWTAVQQCPKADTFYASKELKSVLLELSHSEIVAENFRESFRENFRTSFQGSVSSNLTSDDQDDPTTMFPGYQVTKVSLAKAAIVANVRVPKCNVEYYWIGAFGRWIYLTSNELRNNSNNEEDARLKQQ